MEKPNCPGKIGFFINAFLSICLTTQRIHFSFFAEQKWFWVLIRTILVPKLKCKIQHFRWLSFLHLHGSVNLNFRKVLKLLFTPLLFPQKCNFFFSCVPHTLGTKYGTVSSKNVKYSVRKCFLIAKDGTVPQSLLEHCECQQEEHWTKKKKKNKKKQVRA